MNIQTVRDNLKNTIAGKEQLLKQHYNTLELYKRGAKDNTGAEMAMNATIQFLDINIDELKRILQDVETCVVDYDELKADLKESNGRVRQLERENSDMGWELNPDRMGQ